MIQKIEEFSLNAWPALQILLYDGWVIRCADGYTRRANSVNPLYPSSRPLDAKVAFCEQLYRVKGLSTVFKLTPASSPSELDPFLAQRGYAFEAETSVQLLASGDATFSDTPEVEITEALDEQWFEQFCWMSGLAAGRRPTAWQMLRAIVPAVGYGIVRQAGEPIACGLAVAQGEHIGFFDIVTAAPHRRRGFGEQLMQGLLGWGQRKGARIAYLQVMTEQPAGPGAVRQVGFPGSHTAIGIA